MLIPMEFCLLPTTGLRVASRPQYFLEEKILKGTSYNFQYLTPPDQGRGYPSGVCWHLCGEMQSEEEKRKEKKKKKKIFFFFFFFCLDPNPFCINQISAFIESQMTTTSNLLLTPGLWFPSPRKKHEVLQLPVKKRFLKEWKGKSERKGHFFSFPPVPSTPKSFLFLPRGVYQTTRCVSSVCFFYTFFCASIREEGVKRQEDFFRLFILTHTACEGLADEEKERKKKFFFFPSLSFSRIFALRFLSEKRGKRGNFAKKKPGSKQTLMRKEKREKGRRKDEKRERERSEERRVGKECSEPCRSRWSPYH